ncbi:MAG: hypothetical protein SF052_24225 [Bacteroidia bacterium]|nr:hypothetical protein [Bacteroidia bacterium]
MSIPSFILRAALIASLFVLTGYLITILWLPQVSFAAVFSGIIVSFLTGITAYSITFTGLEKSTRKFVTLLILGMMAKMFIGIILVIIMAVAYRTMIIEYVTSYFLSYFILTAFEVYGLMRKLRA